MSKYPVNVFASLLRFYQFYYQNICQEYNNNDFSMFSLKRMVTLSILFVCIPMLIIWNHVGFILDDIFFYNWKYQVIIDPLFIIGNARSGTTLFHRILGDNNNIFTTMKTWEIIFASSVSWRLFFMILYEIDQKYMNGCMMYMILYVESALFKDIHIHEIGLMKAEEDEWIMVHIFSSQLILLLFPLGLQIPNIITSLICFDTVDNNSFPIEIRVKIMNYYRDCVKRHLYAHRLQLQYLNNPNKQNIDQLRFLSKNPPFTLRIQTLHHVFPNCRIACMIRDPIESIPSMVSYISHVWRAFSSPKIKYPSTKDLIGFCLLHYNYPTGMSKS